MFSKTPAKQIDKKKTKTEKGNCYANFSAWPRRTAAASEKDKSTHIVNYDPGKEVRDELKAVSQYPPTLGNLTVWDQVTSTSSEEHSGAQTYEESDEVPF